VPWWILTLVAAGALRARTDARARASGRNGSMHGFTPTNR
jgi:hypothetical protein